MRAITINNVMDAMGVSVDANLCIAGNDATPNPVGGNDATPGGLYGSATGHLIAGTGCWTYWQDYYYPYVIERSYPVYIQERSLDKGKKAYELIKTLKDKKLVKITTVKQFVDLMDALIEML